MTKFTNSNILSAFRKQMGISKADETAFSEAFQSIFEEALLRDKVVKITGLGTFKLVPVESRKSVNVNTGEAIEIAGHYKLIFTPDTALKDKVNEPLAHLETIELADDIVETQYIAPPISRKEESVEQQYFPLNDEKTPSGDDPLQKLTEQALEIKDILADIQTVTILPEESCAVKQIEQPEQPEQLESLKSFSKPDKTETAETQQMVSAQEIVAQLNKENGVANDRRNTGIWILTAIVLFVVIVALLVYQNIDFFVTSDKNDVQADKTEQIIADESTIQDVQTVDSIDAELPLLEVKESELNQDTLTNEEYIVQSTLSSEIYSDQFSDLFNYKREYIEFIDTVALNGGKRLTLVSLEYYGHKDYWVYIYEANRDKIKHPNSVPAGLKLRIPRLAPELIDASNPETIEYARYLHDVYVKK